MQKKHRKDGRSWFLAVHALCGATLPLPPSVLGSDGWADGWHSVEQPEAWTFGHAVLQSESIGVEAKLFAASTLKGKVCCGYPSPIPAIGGVQGKAVWLTMGLSDYLRLAPAATRFAGFIARFFDQPTRPLPYWRSAHTNPVMCLSRGVVPPDAGVERCHRSCGPGAGYGCAELGRSVGVPDGSPGGGNGRQED